MIQIALVGIGAGLAAALMFVAPLGGTMLALPLFVLSALPIAIAGLAWGSVASLIAALVAAATVGIALAPPAGIIHLALFGAPMAWGCRLAWLSRTDDETGTVEWFPMGRILLHGAAATAIGLIIVGFIIGYDPATLTAELTAALSEWMAQAPDGSPPPSEAELAPFVQFNVTAMPFTTGAILVIFFTVNLWLASRIAESSGRLVRPREPLWQADLPREAAIVFVLAMIGTLLISGAIGHAAGAVAGAFGGALALIGLAVLHVSTIGNSARVLILVAVYVLLVFFGGLPIILLTLLGIAEALFQFRARRPRGAGSNV